MEKSCRDCGYAHFRIHTKAHACTHTHTYTKRLQQPRVLEGQNNDWHQVSLQWESEGEWEMQREGEKTTERERERALFMSLGVLLLHALWELLVLLSNPSAGQGDWDDEGVNWYSKTLWSWQAISGGRVAFVCSKRSERQSIGLPVSSALSFHSFPSLLHQCDWSIFHFFCWCMLDY